MNLDNYSFIFHNNTYTNKWYVFRRDQYTLYWNEKNHPCMEMGIGDSPEEARLDYFEKYELEKS